MKDLIEYARRFIGIHYKYGGKSPAEGIDCSGLVQIILKYAGMDPPGDQNAQAYYNLFLVAGIPKLNDVSPGALVFYGKSPSSIDHVAIVSTKYQVVEAAGGDHTTLTIEDAIKRRAFVRERPITDRKDIIAILMPVYPDWLKNA